MALRTRPWEQKVGELFYAPLEKNKKKGQIKDTQVTRFGDENDNHSPTMAPEMLVDVF